MGPWLETIGVVLVAVAGVALGRRFARCSKPWWVLLYLIPSGIILLMLGAKVHEAWVFGGPVSWIVAGRARFVFVSLAVTLGLIMPLPHLPKRWERIVVGVFMVTVVGWFSVLPFLVPALIQHRLAALETRLNAEGVCLQSTNYTCGPAAAVTALGKLGIQAEEGQLAVLARTNPLTGTLPESLSSVLEQLYGREGLRCEYRQFESLAELAQAGLTLAVVHDRGMRDHCVAVLRVTERLVTIGDPSVGQIQMSRELFAEQWRGRGIVVKRGS